ncbi:MAG TPA: dihydrolipoyl dehydrogenase [Anaerolineae bacterium]|nr:dihydrolipoyl dehydrogenase [Anaerolineae bacterium]
MSENTYDLIVIGAGPGGYIAAERAGAKGKKALLIEKEHLGGVCLNRGCIPSKTLLYSAKLFTQAQHSQAYGVYVENPYFDLSQVMARKQKTIETLRRGIAFQMKRHHVEVVQGEATLVDRRTVQVNDSLYQADNIIIATGSSPIQPPIPGADQPHVLTSDQILDIDALPESLVIIGGGVIGCEFASFFSSVGVKVAVIEMLPEILPMMDAELATMLRKSMKGVDFHIGCKVQCIVADNVTYDQDGKQHTIAAETVLMSIGRKPNVAGLGLEKVGVDFDQRGIKVNDRLQTNIPGIYAIGDVNTKSMLAHAASRMGEVAVNNMFGRPDVMRYQAIPWVVYTMPEIASVGLTETQAAAQGIATQTASLPMTANGRFLAENEGKRGLWKVVVDAQTQALLGVHIIGAAASELIYGAAAMIEDEFRVQDIEEVVFPHPTVSEIFKDTLFEIHT